MAWHILVSRVLGFQLKLDSSKVIDLALIDSDYLTEWSVLGGPVIGFHFKGAGNNLSLIIGDICRPKYIGARQLSMRLGEEREVTFYWQISAA